MKHFLFTSESVTEGHPDKIADQISDAIVDDLLRQDPLSRVAAEVLVTTGLVFVAGEIRTRGYADIARLARETIRRIGYDDATYGFDYKACSVLTAIGEQSADIALGVDHGGAGDQGSMFGFAVDETKELMPMPIMQAHRLCRRLAEVRKKRILSYLRPDGKSQVTVEYRDGKPFRIDSIVISTQHGPHVTQKRIRDDVIEHVIRPVCGKMLDRKTIYYVNPTGRFIIGGPPGDCGLTGRKIIADTYGGYAPHGGGAFSGKDPSKVDRSASYMARYAAKNIVAAGLAKKCEIQVSYAIGIKKPVSLYANTFGTGKIDDEKLSRFIARIFDFTPQGMIRALDLRRPIYGKTACYGHFGRGEFAWEKINKARACARKFLQNG